MRMHFDDLRSVERLLVAGKLEDAKALAYMVTVPPKDPGIASWAAGTARVVDAATKLTIAPGIDEACRRVARVAEACAECHVRNPKRPSFVRTSAPPDLPTPAARMARHQWAVDRLWEGVVGPIDESWRAGLQVLSTTPLPFSRLTDAPVLASHLQKRAAEALIPDATDGVADRARAYGEMLVTCAACHSTLKGPAGAEGQRE
jgi:mono/diheme cytochrome c family protein